MTNGLTSAQAQQKLAEIGLNLLPEKKPASAIKALIGQFNNPLSLLLILAAVFSFIISDLIDGWLILLILILNGILGFWQEYKASKELEALRRLEVLDSRVIRDDKQIEIPSSELVPGDLVILEAGDKIPSDGQLLEAFSLSVNESALSGESLPVMKSTKNSENEVYFGTVVISGRGKFLISATGSQTRFGRIALTLAEVSEEQTPLEVSLSGLGKKLGILALLIALGLFVVRILQGFEVFQVLLTSIALMVAAVPEGLPAVVTIILSIGVHRMYKHKALVRKMAAVESLGATTVICTDKTGTLTANEMRVKQVITDKQELLLQCAVLCNSASLVLKEDHGSFDILGDTTEGALLLWAKEQGLDIEQMRAKGTLVEEQPFDLKTRMMTTVWQDSQTRIFAKGAPEVILQKSDLSSSDLAKYTQDYQNLSVKGLRVLGFGCSDSRQGKMKFLGLIGIADQVRPEAVAAVAQAKKAGIKVVMITGDNELTAKAIAEEVGLLEEGDEVMLGSQLEELTEQELQSQIGRVKIFARVLPEHKLKIVKTYQSLGEVVAVTGDGVNDSLALKQAHVGVAMGGIGTDVAKEASDIVLLDDNFATLVTAIEQGRLIYSNILKVIKFLLAGNLSEVLLITLAAVGAFPSPLLPVQILWINLVTDGLPALALGAERSSSRLMSMPPRRNSNLLNGDMLRFIGIGGFVIAISVLIGFHYLLDAYGLSTARSFAFSAIVFLQMILVFLIRRHHSPFSNIPLLLSVGLILLLQVLIMTVPELRLLFKL